VTDLLQQRALVLFSGGQDSATCLAWALETFGHVETLGFHYGQRHAIEMETRQQFLSRLRQIRPEWSAKLYDDHCLNAHSLSDIGDTALTRQQEIALMDDGLPNTFVPGRNLLFFVLAGALATRRSIRHLIAGMCETDYSGYPDCRDDTLKAMQVALSLGLGQPMTFHTPLMFTDKADTFAMAEQLGGASFLELVLEETHTCYLGNRDLRHEWGYGCGTCPACDLRAKGYALFMKGREKSVKTP
jgi:7-cyano-7-deazaguanine synthase